MTSSGAGDAAGAGHPDGPRRMAQLSLDTLADLAPACRTCLRWELDAGAAQRAAAGGDPAFEKEAWLSSLLLTWGGAGRVAYVGEQPVGHASIASSAHAPRAGSFWTSPVSPDAAVLVTVRVDRSHQGRGIARMLVQGVAKDLTERGIRALEAFAIGPGEGDGTPSPCLLPQAFYEAVGFSVVRDHPLVPRMRLELGAALDWREDVEAALEQLLGSLALTR